MSTEPDPLAPIQPSLRSQVGLTALTNILLAGVGVLTGVVAARILGPNGRGELAAMQLWPTTIASLALMGLPEALVFLSAREPRGAERYLGSSVFLGLVISLPVMIASYFALPYLLSAQDERVLGTARVLLLIIPLYSLVGLPGQFLRGKGDIATWNLIRVMPAVGWIAVLAIAAAAGYSARGIAFGHLLMMALLIAPVWIVARSRLSTRVRASTTDWQPLLRYGWPNALTGLPQLVNQRLDQLLIAGILRPQQLGLYVVAVAWAGAMQPLLSAVGSVLFPRVAAADPEHQAAALVSGVRAGTTAALAAVAPLLAITPFLLPLLFGKAFSDAVPVASVLVIASGFLGMNLILEDGLRGLGRPREVLKGEVIGASATALSLLILLPWAGILGAGLASLLGYGASTISLTRSVSLSPGVTARELFRPRWAELRAAIGSLLRR